MIEKLKNITQRIKNIDIDDELLNDIVSGIFMFLFYSN